MTPEMESVLREVSSLGLINDHTPSIDLFDLDYLDFRLDSLLEAFPESFFLHAAAMKANSIRGVMQAVRAKGLGAECASLSEVLHALEIGFAPETVVFDSPCKTRHDLATALSSNVTLNLDNEHEIRMVADLLAGKCAASRSKIGLRINPVTGGRCAANVSMSTKISKFGVPVTNETRREVVRMYRQHPWMTGIHVHVGSQGVPLELFVKGVRACMDIVLEIESESGRRLEMVDIGGGLSTSYKEEHEPEGFSYTVYREQLQAEVPELFSGRFRVITEFGRSLFLKAGRSITRVEHVKHWIRGVKPVVLTHVGTNQFVREAYLPDRWTHRISLVGPDGRVKRRARGDRKRYLYDIAGPLCFQGDYLAKDVSFPAEAASGDWIVVHDTGAYCMVMYSKFCSILPSAVYGFRAGEKRKKIRSGEEVEEEKEGVKLFCFKERETPEENLRFWGRKMPRSVEQATSSSSS